LIRDDVPNGAFSRLVYYSWRVEEADLNDTVNESAYGTLRKMLPAGDPERQAYDEAAAHANTLQITYLDPLARHSGHRAQGGPTAADRFTQSHLDLNGCELDVVDPRGITAFRSRYDMQDQPCYQVSADGGELRRLSDAYGRETHTWDGRGFNVVRRYDALDRPLATHTIGGDGAPLDHQVEEWVYGESLGDRNDAIARNLLGRVAITRDGAQQMTVQQSDPTGRVTRMARQLRAVVDSEPDWRAAVPLEPDVFVESGVFDALGRTKSETLADGTVRTFRFALSGALTEVRITTPDGMVANVPVLSSMSVNARGQRLNRRLGNGVSVDWVYDPATHREASQTAAFGGQMLQKLSYTYDPSGNIVRVTDDAQEAPNAILSGLAVAARRDYTYDAHYRLLQATGRVHQALLQNDFVPGTPGAVKGTRHITLNNGVAIERFTRTYDFDLSGNLRSIRHVGASQTWTTGMWISPTSNRSVSALDLNGIAIANPESSFDASGNLIAMSHLRKAEWNWRNSLARAVVILRPGGTDDAERYVYGGDAMRVRKLTTRVLQGGMTEVTEKVYFHDLERKRITLGGRVILERWSIHVSDSSERAAIVHRWTRDDNAREVDHIPTARVHYQLTIQPASVAMELDVNGALISYEEYFPYGGTAFIAGDNLRAIDRRDYRYSGEECDDFTGLYAYGYRYYAPWVGRWISPDPGGPSDDLNLYQFALGDPVRNVDPDGLDTEPGKINYVRRAEVVPANSSDDARIGAARASLSPVLQPLFDSLSRSDKLRFASPNGSRFTLVPRNIENFAAGGELISRQDFVKKFLPKAVAWGKKHHMEIGVEKTLPADDADPNGTGLGGGDSDAPGAPPADGSSQKKDAGPGGGNGAGGTGEDGKDQNAAGAADGGTGTLAGSRQGTGQASGADQGDGKAIGPGTGKDSAPGAGTGAGTGGADKGAGDGGNGGPGSGTGAGSGQKPRTGTGAKAGNPQATGSQPGGGPDGVLGGTPFSTGNSLDGLGNPLSNAPASNGSDPEGQTTRRRHAGGRPDGTIDGSPKGRGSQGGGTGRGTGRGAPTGTGAPPGMNKTGSLRGTDAAHENANANATGHGDGDGSGSGKTGDTGALAAALKIAGYTNFEFGQDDPNGQAGGIPGGAGFLKGKAWQFIYLAVSAVSLVLAVKAVIQSVAKGVLGRLFAALRSPRAILREFGLFLREGGQAWRKFWRPSGGVGPGKRMVTFFRAMFLDGRAWKSIREFRRDSFLFKPRWFGTLERVGQRSLYTWEHIIPQSVGRNYPRLRPFINSYLNSFLRLPMEFNSALGNRWGPKLQFYVGAVEALGRSWKFGNWIGEKAIADTTRESPALQPAK